MVTIQYKKIGDNELSITKGMYTVPELNNARVVCYKTELYNPFEVVIREYSNTLDGAVSAFEQYKGAVNDVV